MIPLSSRFRPFVLNFSRSKLSAGFRPFLGFLSGRKDNNFLPFFFFFFFFFLLLHWRKGYRCSNKLIYIYSFPVSPIIEKSFINQWVKTGRTAGRTAGQDTGQSSAKGIKKGGLRPPLGHSERLAPKTGQTAAGVRKAEYMNVRPCATRASIGLKLLQLNPIS